MRVLLVGTGVQPIPPTGYGGVERTIAEYASALRTAGHEAMVLNDVRRGRSTDEYRFAWHLRQRLDGLAYDVVHASTPVVANRLAMLGRPFVYTTHSRHWFETGGTRGRWGLFLETRAVRRAAHTVALTRRLQERILARVGRRIADHCSVVPIGVDLERFQPEWARRGRLQALGVGVVRPFKRWEVAARALRGTGWTLTIVGPTPDAGYAAALRSLGDHVRLLGEVDEATLTRAYAESDLLVHPSRVELLAGVVLQGLASALPVLGAEAVAELIGPGCGGAAGPGASDAEVEQFLKDSVEVYAREPDRLRVDGLNARESARTRFAWPKIVAEHVALYERLGREGRLSR